MENKRDKKKEPVHFRAGSENRALHSRSESSDDRRSHGCCYRHENRHRENFRLRHHAVIHRLRRAGRLHHLRKDDLARNMNGSAQSTNGSVVNTNAMAGRARSTNAAEQSTSGLEANTNAMAWAARSTNAMVQSTNATVQSTNATVQSSSSGPLAT